MIRRLLSLQTSPYIKVSEFGTTGVIQLNRPDALNAINMEMFQHLHELIRKFEKEKDVVIVKGTGKVFSAGGDVKQVTTTTIENVKNGYRNSCRAFDLIANYRKPYVALVDGLAMGGAAIYAIPGKYRVATERTTFSMPETAIGYFNDAGGSYFLSRLNNNLGIYLGMTGARLSGYDMVKSQLSTHFVNSNRIDELEMTLISCKTHENVANTLKKFSSVPASIETELDSILPKIEKCFGASTVEQIYQNLENDGSEWAKKTIKTLKRMSPTSLIVTHRCINIGRTLSIRDNLKMEFMLVIRHMIDSDLYEDCRAVLVDKDHKPNWKEVSESRINSFFEPLEKNEELSFTTS